eukprot:COSAG02_NODE_110_length_36062_cov_85.812106_19_plen_73_part_00
MAVNRFMFFSIPVITAVVTFITFTMLGNEMDASLVFSSMALLNLIQECAGCRPVPIKYSPPTLFSLNRHFDV